MIIQRSILARLSPSLKQTVPDVNDGTMQVPANFSFVGLPPEPMFPQSVTGGRSEGSFMREFTLQVLAGAGSNVQLGVLASGYWRIHIEAAYRSNYLLATSTAGNARIFIDNGSIAPSLVHVFASGTPTVPIVQRIDFQEDFLFPVDQTIQLQMDTNIATQEHTMAGLLICQRLL